MCSVVFGNHSGSRRRMRVVMFLMHKKFGDATPYLYLSRVWCQHWTFICLVSSCWSLISILSETSDRFGLFYCGLKADTLCHAEHNGVSISSVKHETTVVKDTVVDLCAMKPLILTTRRLAGLQEPVGPSSPGLLCSCVSVGVVSHNMSCNLI